jgi:hypothetical protein
MDVFQQVPDDVLLEILKLCEMCEVGRYMLISRRWRDQCRKIIIHFAPLSLRTSVYSVGQFRGESSNNYIECKFKSCEKDTSQGDDIVVYTSQLQLGFVHYLCRPQMASFVVNFGDYENITVTIPLHCGDIDPNENIVYSMDGEDFDSDLVSCNILDLPESICDCGNDSGDYPSDEGDIKDLYHRFIKISNISIKINATKLLKKFKVECCDCMIEDAKNVIHSLGYNEKRLNDKAIKKWIKNGKKVESLPLMFEEILNKRFMTAERETMLRLDFYKRKRNHEDYST